MSTEEGRPKAVSILFRNAQGQVFAVSRKTDHADLGLPGGSVEDGESWADAAIRETQEEVGVRITRMRLVFDHPCRVHYAYTFEVDAYEGELVSVEGAWVGWVDPAKLLEPHCSFREYNRALFEHLGMI